MSASHKYPRGVSARPAGSVRPIPLLEQITLVHVGALVVFAAWAFGGNAGWSRIAIALWGSFGVLITLTALQNDELRKGGHLRPLRWLWPLVLFNGLVLAGVFNPSFHEVTDEKHVFFVQNQLVSAYPSSARPDRSLLALWFFDAVYLSCFNLVLIVRQRRALRGLLLVLSANAVLLAIFGTAQKLVGAKGLFFGLTASPQPYFFSSFIYHNHWGAFTVLMVALSLGLIFHFVRRRDRRDFWHSPAFAGLVAILLLAASVPLSTSRSCTVLVGLLLGVAFLHGLARIVRRRRAYKESVVAPVGLAVLAVAVAGWFAYDLARPVIATRVAATEAQIADMRAGGSFGSRETLYRDTVRMAGDRPWFGWGMASYSTVFNLYNSQHISPVDGLPKYFDDAHSDWLQSAAEVGLAGTALLGLCALVPLWHRRRFVAQSPLTLYLLGGCGLVALYAWLEFPFGNGAVIAAFWTCFFTAVHYGRLEAPAESAAP